MKPVLIVGCGYVGQRLIRQLPEGAAITAVARSEETCAALRALEVQVLQRDLDQDDLQLPTREAEVYYFAPPPGEGDTDPRMRRFLASLQQTGLPHRILYISTSGVYGDCQGAWIDESQPINPGTPRGRRRADAEQSLQAFMQDSAVPVVILRVPGIYGPGKLPLARLKQGLPLLRAEDAPFTNRIHADDLVAACLAAMACGEPGTAYNVADGQPSNMADYFNRIAAVFELPPPPTVTREEAKTALTQGMQAFMNESKRLDVTRLRSELGVQLKYDVLETGLQQCRDELLAIPDAEYF